MIYYILNGKSTHLSLQVILLGLVEVLQPLPVGPLRVGVDVHLDDAVVHRLPDLLLGRTRPAVHHQEGRLVLATTNLLFDEFLVKRHNCLHIKVVSMNQH